MTTWDKLAERGCRVLDGLCVACLAAMVVMVFGNVVLRYVFNSGITISEELSRWLFVWMTFLGAISAVREHGHLGTDVVVGRLGPAGRRVCVVLTYVAMLGVNVLLFQGSLAQTRINADVEAPVSGLPMGVVYASGVVFAVLSSLLILRELWRALSGQARDDELLAVRESEELQGPGAARNESGPGAAK
jgi:TRAP-type C4-dicarboxylate transport system permease small subunit